MSRMRLLFNQRHTRNFNLYSCIVYARCYLSYRFDEFEECSVGVTDGGLGEHQPGRYDIEVICGLMHPVSILIVQRLQLTAVVFQ